MDAVGNMLDTALEENNDGICFLEAMPGRQKLSLIYKLWNVRSYLDKAIKKLAARKTRFSYPYEVY